jgi:surface protein
MDANGWLVVCALGKKDDADAQGDCTLYIEFTKRKLDNLPKRPNDGTKRDTVASGWFDDDAGFPEFGMQPWYPWRERIGRVIVLDNWVPKSCRYLFDGLNYCVRFDLLGLDTSRANSFGGMFRGCSSVEQLLDADRFNTSNVEDMSYMFMNCLKLRAVSMVGWNTLKVTNVEYMFSGCEPYVLVEESQTAFLDEVVHSTVHGVWSRAVG